MSTLFNPLQLLSVALAGWMNRYQQAVIDYLVAENQLLRNHLGFLTDVSDHPVPTLLKEQLDGRRLRLADNQRRRLAVKVKALGRRGIRELETLVTADTLPALLCREGIKPVLSSPRAPNCKDYASHGTSSARFDATLGKRRRIESFRPWALTGGSSPGCSYRHSFLSL